MIGAALRWVTATDGLSLVQRFCWSVTRRVKFAVVLVAVVLVAVKLNSVVSVVGTVLSWVVAV